MKLLSTVHKVPKEWNAYVIPMRPLWNANGILRKQRIRMESLCKASRVMSLRMNEMCPAATAIETLICASGSLWAPFNSDEVLTKFEVSERGGVSSLGRCDALHLMEMKVGVWSVSVQGQRDQCVLSRAWRCSTIQLLHHSMQLPHMQLQMTPSCTQSNLGLNGSKSGPCCSLFWPRISHLAGLQKKQSQCRHFSINIDYIYC